MKQVIERDLLVLPKLDFLSLSESQRFVQLDALCKELKATSALAATARDWIEAAAGNLDHPLQPIALHNGGPLIYRPSTHEAEQRSAKKYGSPMLEALRGLAVPEFKRLVVEMFCDMASKVRFRDRSVGLQPDVNDNYIIFPPAPLIEGQLHRIGRFLLRNQRNQSFAALGAQVAILNLHPLNDGNGRLSRVICGAALLEGQDQLHRYLSVYELRRFKPYRFEIALRSAELHGNWLDLTSVYIELAKAYIAEASSTTATHA